MKKLKIMMVAALALFFFAMFGITLRTHLSVGEKKETYPRIKYPVLDSRIVFLIGSGTDEDPFIAIPIPDSLHYRLSDNISPDVYYNALGEIVDSAKSARFRGDIYRSDLLYESVSIIHKYLFEDL